MSAPKKLRGRCDECGFRFPLRVDGTVQSHRLWIGPWRLGPCSGSGKRARASQKEQT